MSIANHETVWQAKNKCSQKPLKLAGEIVWSSLQGSGVKFTHLTRHRIVNSRF